MLPHQEPWPLEVRLGLLPARHPLEVVLPLVLLRVLEQLLVPEFRLELMALFRLSLAWVLQGWVWDLREKDLECFQQGLLVRPLMMREEPKKVWAPRLEPGWVQELRLRELPGCLQALEGGRGKVSHQVTTWARCSLEPQ